MRDDSFDEEHIQGDRRCCGGGGASTTAAAIADAEKPSGGTAIFSGEREDWYSYSNVFRTEARYLGCDAAFDVPERRDHQGGYDKVLEGRGRPGPTARGRCSMEISQFHWRKERVQSQRSSGAAVHATPRNEVSEQWLFQRESSSYLRW